MNFKFLEHSLVGVIVGALISIIPIKCQLSQQQRNFLQDKKWEVVTSYPSTHKMISACPQNLRNAFYKVADTADVKGPQSVSLKDLDEAFNILEQCNEGVISAYISLAGIGQSTKPLDCLSSTLAVAKQKMNDVPMVLRNQSKSGGDITTSIGPALKNFSESWTKCMKDLNEDTLVSAKSILSE